MSVMTYNNLALDWAPVNKRDSFFNRLTLVIVAFAFAVGLIMTSIDLL